MSSKVPDFLNLPQSLCLAPQREHSLPLSWGDYEVKLHPQLDNTTALTYITSSSPLGTVGWVLLRKAGPLLSNELGDGREKNNCQWLFNCEKTCTSGWCSKIPEPGIFTLGLPPPHWITVANCLISLRLFFPRKPNHAFSWALSEALPMTMLVTQLFLWHQKVSSRY